MVKLNLPQFDCVLKNEDGKIFILDIIRKKYLVLTPEEWVRQHFVNYLINTLGYPRALIKVEGGLRYNALQKRSDIVVHDRDGNPWMVVECKSPELKLTQRALSQASMYNDTLKAKFLTITNGLVHIACAVDWKSRRTVQLSAMPEYGLTQP